MFDLNNNDISTVLLLIVLGLLIWYLTKPNNEKFTNNEDATLPAPDSTVPVVQNNVEVQPVQNQVPQMQVPQMQVQQMQQEQQMPQVQQMQQAPQVQVPQMQDVNNFQAFDGGSGDGADINAAEADDGYTALMWASYKGYLEVVRLLIEKGADVNAAETDDGYTALMWASQEGHAEVVKLLLDRGAQINIQSNIGLTAVMFSSCHGRIECARLLLQRGADMSLKTKTGMTAKDEAAKQRHVDIVQLLNEVSMVQVQDNLIPSLQLDFDHFQCRHFTCI
jgi:hypothetical protein